MLERLRSRFAEDQRISTVTSAIEQYFQPPRDVFDLIVCVGALQYVPDIFGIGFTFAQRVREGGRAYFKAR